MSLIGKRETVELPSRGPSGTPSRETPGALIDKGAECSGKFRFASDVRIDGSLEGELDCKGTLVIGASGRVDAQIRAENVIIHGEANGDIVAQSQITLQKDARVKGDMRTAGIVIEPGAQVEGRIAIGAEQTESPTVPPSPRGVSPLQPPE